MLEIRECISEAFDVKLSTSTAVTKKRRVRLDTEMTDFVTRLTESVTKFEDRVEQLLRACDKSAARQLTELLHKREDETPVRGNVSPPEALAVLTNYELSMKKAHVHQENLVRAKDALGLEHAIESTEIVECLNELSDLKEVWEAVMEPYKILEQLKDAPWSTAIM